MGCELQQRYVLAVMLFFSLVVSLSLRHNLPIVLTQMVNVPNVSNKTDTVDVSFCPIQNTTNFLGTSLEISTNTSAAAEQLQNVTQISGRNGRPRFQWSQKLQGIILSSYYWGYVLLQLPGGVLAQKFGGKYIILGGVFASGMLTFMIPWAIDIGGAYGLITIRVLMGLCQGPLYPSLAAFLAAWIPIKERGRLSSMIYTGSSVAGVFSTYISGLLLSHFDNWSVVLYFFGTFAMIWCVLFSFLCSSEPESHPFINAEEKKYLTSELNQYRKRLSEDSQPDTPWTSIVTSAPVLALVFISCAYDWSHYVVTTDLPKYMNDVIHVSVHKNGIYSAMPRVISLIVAWTGGCICDWMMAKTDLSITNIRKTFVITASVIPAFFILAASYAGCNEALVVTLFMISTGIQGLMTVGIMLNPMDLSPVFASTLSGIMNCSGSVMGILAPYVVGVLTPHSLLTEWRMVFWITFCVHIAEAVIFAIWGSGRVQPWNSVKVGEDKESKPLEIVDSTKL